MKKFNLFTLYFFALGIALAQTVSDFDFVPTTTDNNMSIVFPAGTLNDFVGGDFMAFKTDGTPVSASSEIAFDGSAGIPVMGSDGMCDCDLADAGEQLSFAILMNDETVVNIQIQPPLTYGPNGFVTISQEYTSNGFPPNDITLDSELIFTIDGAEVVFGCRDDIYLEFNASANLDDGSCATHIVEGCMDVAACNIIDTANVDDGSCIYAQDFYDCDDVCLSDQDSDGVCTELEVDGCTNPDAFNYNEEATGTESILHAEWDSLGGICVPIVFGCTESWADNFDPQATQEDGSCYKYGCMADWADNFDPFATLSSLELPEPFVGNTGSNMTVMLTSTFITSLEITDDNVYLFAFNQDGLVIGSVHLYGSSYNQYSIAVWGDDSQTPDVDGALANEAVSFQLVNGTDLYDVEMPSSVSFVANGLYVQTAAATLTLASGDDDECSRFGCTAEWADNFDELATDDDGSCERLGCMAEWADNFDPQATQEDGSCYKYGCMADWADNFDPFATLSSLELPEPFVGNTGSNMTVMLTSTFITSLEITDDNVYLFAFNQDGLVIGSVHLYGSSYNQYSIAVWGDDSQTPDVDGALANEAVSFQLVNGTDLYDVEMPSSVSFVANGLYVQTAAATLTLASGDDASCERLGCMAEWADNYDDLATEDDGSCYRSGCTSDWADNFDPQATQEDGSCYKYGCMADWADNFDPQATQEDGSCYKYGCMADWADNFDPQATQEDGSCYKYGCMADWADNFDPFATLSASELPEFWSVNTGANMSLMLTSHFS